MGERSQSDKRLPAEPARACRSKRDRGAWRPVRPARTRRHAARRPARAGDNDAPLSARTLAPPRRRGWVRAVRPRSRAMPPRSRARWGKPARAGQSQGESGAIVASEGPERPARRGAGLNALLGLTDYAQEGFGGRAGALWLELVSWRKRLCKPPKRPPGCAASQPWAFSPCRPPAASRARPRRRDRSATPQGRLRPGSRRTQSETWGRRFDANPGDVAAAINYARALRGLDQHAQALAVLQQAAIRNPEHLGFWPPTEKRWPTSAGSRRPPTCFSRAHTAGAAGLAHPVGAGRGRRSDGRPCARAAAITRPRSGSRPNEPSVLSNLGLSYALAKRLGDAERVLKHASAQPNADARVRQNLALVLGLQGKFPEAEEVCGATSRPRKPPPTSPRCAAWSRSRTAGTPSAAPDGRPSRSETAAAPNG